MATAVTQGNKYTGGISFTSPYRNAEGAINGGFNFDLPLATVATFQNQALSFTANNANLNRQFVGGVINKAQAHVDLASQRGFDFNDMVLKQTIDLQSRIHQNRMEMIEEVKSSRGCFITTAICEHRELPDDNEILNTFRAFRDKQMTSDFDKELIDEYYARAPEMVDVLNKRDDKDKIISWLNDEFLMPAYLLIKNHNYTAAKAVYVCMFHALDATINGAENE